MELDYDELNEAERRVVGKTAEGDMAALGDLPDRTVRADLLRQLLLRLKPGAGFGDPFMVHLPGVRIRDARIVGALDLKDCAGREGEGLPALELNACDIPDPIDISHARLARLSIAQSRFTQLVGHGVRIDGPFDFSEAGFPVGDDAARATIDLRGAIIAGEVVGHGARLRFPLRDGDIAPWATEYALRMSDADIRGNVTLDQGFVAHGGATISASHVRGEVWMSRATFICGESHAFNARGVVIDGPLMMIDGFRAIGRVGLRNGEINGDFSLGRERVVADDGEAPRAGASIEGVLDLRGAVIRGSLELGGSTFSHPDRWAIDAAGVHIGDDLTMRVASASMPSGDAATVHTTVTGGLRFDGARIDGEVHWFGLTFHGATERKVLISLADAVIGRALKPQSLKIHDAIERGAKIDLSGARCAALDDNLAEGWGPERVHLALDGFFYGRLERDHQGRPGRKSSDRWQQRRRWLRKRFEAFEGYHPQPYAHLARVYSEAGWIDDMRRVQRRRLTLHLRHEEHWWAKPLVALHWLVAGYGYAPHRAAITLFVFLLAGWIGVQFANQRHALIYDVEYTDAGSQGANVAERWCGAEISEPLYALDVAIPLIDLRQESKCEPGAPAGVQLYEGVPIPGTGLALFEEIAVWRWAKALYALLGALLTAIAVITFTGVLRSSNND